MKTIPLTRGYSAIVDDDDFERVSKFKWQVNLGSVRPRACTNKSILHGIKQTYMHRFIINAPSGMDVDHINRDSLDNRKCNLRIATRTQNNGNAVRKFHTSKFKGVSWDKSRKKWTASGGRNHKRVSLGRFDNEEDAARAYDTWASQNYGRFARPNFAS